MSSVKKENIPPPIVTLWKDGLVDRVDVAPLSRDEAYRLVGDVVGGQIVNGYKMWMEQNLDARAIGDNSKEQPTKLKRGSSPRLRARSSASDSPSVAGTGRPSCPAASSSASRSPAR